MNALGEIGWTDERTALAVKLWKEDGLSAAQIAARLGGGATRNSVIGKLHRMKLTEVAKPVGARRTPDRRANRHDTVQPKPRYQRKHTVAGIEQRQAHADGDATRLLGSAVWQPLEGTTPLSLEALGQHDCKWPLGDPLLPGFGYCGMPRAHDATSYCAVHHRVSVEQVR